MDKFIEKLEFLAKNQVSLIATGVAAPDIFQELQDLKEYLKSKDIPMAVNVMLGKYKKRIYPRGYTDEELKTVENLVYSREEFHYPLGKRVRGSFCYAGVNSVFVNLQSSVYRCRKYGRANCFKLGKLKNFRKLKTPKPCIFTRCVCLDDFSNTKEFSDKYTMTHNYRIYFDSKSDAKIKPTILDYFVAYALRIFR